MTHAPLAAANHGSGRHKTLNQVFDKDVGMNTFERTALVEHLDALAATTWHKVSIGPKRGHKFREESITDHNLFALDEAHAALTVYKFDSGEEPLNGADFDWWLGSDTAGWTGIRFQAKKLDDGVYAKLGYRVGVDRQYDLLIEEALSDGVWPFYCFYNGWEGGWPPAISNAACRNGREPVTLNSPRGRDACTHVSLEHFGCAVAPAQAVRRRHRGARRGRLEFESYLPASVPWSRMFEGTSRFADVDPQMQATTVQQDVESNLGAFFASQDLPDQGGSRLPELPAWVEAVRRGERGEARYARKPRALVLFDLATG